MKKLWSEVEQEFFDNLDVSELTKKNYRDSLNQFKKWVVKRGISINNLRRSDILAYKSSLINSNKAEGTMDIYLLVVRLFFTFVEEFGYGENIAAAIRYKRKAKGHTKSHLSNDEIKRLLDSCDRSTLIGARNYAIIRLMITIGLRCVEVSRLCVGDMNTTGDVAYILVQRKGQVRKNAKLGITPHLVEIITTYLSMRGASNKDEPMFMSQYDEGMSSRGISNVVTYCMKKAGVYSHDKTAHSLRHTMAVQAIQFGVPMRELQVLLGHSNVKTTEIYLNSIDEELRLKNSVVSTIENKLLRIDKTGEI